MAFPISIKDNLATIGVPTTGGSKILADWKPDFDATVVRKIKGCRRHHLGQTNMHEWALGGTTINPFFEHLQRNPWGSSAGAWRIERRFCRRCSRRRCAWHRSVPIARDRYAIRRQCAALLG
jgi:aspartyl-tRNA(Asn)/glutamyl-tRNA(Gln) amidotransferase subunit A